MKKQDLIQFCKYYKGEESAPEKIAGTRNEWWWQGEKILCDKIDANGVYWETLSESYNEAKKEGALSGRLIDSSIPLPSRYIIYFLDIWNGKMNPYDIDLIHEY